MAEPFLVADIGGTNARFALASIQDKTISLHEVQNFRAEDFEAPRDAADAYIKTVGKPRLACFAVAGPVTNPVIAFTNSHWALDIAAMQEALSLERLQIVNDFEALASGVPFLKRDDLLSVKPGAGDPNAPVLVLGPGTGLGQAMIVPGDNGGRVVSTEGGHVSFAPRTEEEIAVMQFLAQEHSRVSVERLLSGPGLVNIHRALSALEGEQPAPFSAAEITLAAMKKSHPIAVKTADMFCDVMGRVAGDAVLACGARGGVVLGGGILPRIQDIFLRSAFVERFLEKGRMRAYVEPVPVDLIIRDGAALLGAAAILMRRE